MSDLLNIIPADDGYNQEFFLKSVPNVHTDVRGTFRPALHAERYAINEEIQKRKSGPASRFMCEVISKYVRAWNIKGQDGSALPITVENIVRVKPKIIERLYAMIAGWDGGDVDEGAAPNQAEAELGLEAVLLGVSKQVAREASDEKNSASG